MRLYRIDIHGRDEHGVFTWMNSGDLILIDGVEHVRLAHGVIVPRGDGWCETLEEARCRAAERIDAIAERLARQAKDMRKGVTDANG